MYRRDFFKTMIVTPFLGPFLLASQSSEYDELFLISDKPQIILPSLLAAFGKLKSIFEAVAERLTPLSTAYLAVNLLAVAIILVRNI